MPVPGAFPDASQPIAIGSSTTGPSSGGTTSDVLPTAAHPCLVGISAAPRRRRERKGICLGDAAAAKAPRNVVSISSELVGSEPIHVDDLPQIKPFPPIWSPRKTKVAPGPRACHAPLLARSLWGRGLHPSLCRVRSPVSLLETRYKFDAKHEPDWRLRDRAARGQGESNAPCCMLPSLTPPRRRQTA